ncbi:MAG: lytic transglycosylase domain-containing protein [Rhodocyclaceae bacterium]|nr:lytic transglycosylase domain-containing protein [Rhodocyclaceae bacterium]
MQNATTFMAKAAGAIGLLALLSTANATCWEAASVDYGIPVEVLKAVAKTESGFNPRAKNVNANASVDHGLMQINDSWLPTLKAYGIDQTSLADACTNLKVGAWILSNNAKRLGWNWNVIGAYNVGCKALSAAECQRRRNVYAWKIYKALNKVAVLNEHAPAAAMPVVTARKTLVVSFSDTSHIYTPVAVAEESRHVN